MASRSSGEIGSSLTVCLARKGPIRFKINLNVDHDIRKVFLNLVSEYVFQTVSPQPVFLPNRRQERGTVAMLSRSDEISNKSRRETFKTCLLRATRWCNAICMLKRLLLVSQMALTRIKSSTCEDCSFPTILNPRTTAADLKGSMGSVMELSLMFESTVELNYLGRL